MKAPVSALADVEHDLERDADTVELRSFSDEVPNHPSHPSRGEARAAVVSVFRMDHPRTGDFENPGNLS